MNKFILGIANSIAGFFESSAYPAAEPNNMKKYEEYLKNTAPSAEELHAHRDHIMAKMPLISVIMLASNASERDIIDSVKSVAVQTYRNIELCAVASSARKTLDSLTEYDFAKVLIIDKSIRDMISTAVERTSGDYVLFLPAGDILQVDFFYKAMLSLNKCAMSPECIYCDNDCLVGGERNFPHLSPEFSPNTICSNDYIGNGFIISKSLYNKVGGLNSFSAEDMYDLRLRASEEAEDITHISYVGYTYKGARPVLALQKARTSLDMHIKRIKRRGHAVSGLYDGSFRLHYAIPKKTDVEIIIPCYGDTDKLRLCLEHIEDYSTYENYTITVADMGVKDSRMARYQNALKNSQAARIVTFPPNTSRAKAMNVCARDSYAQAMVFLDYSVRILSADWMESMLEHSQLADVGAVGTKIITPDSRIVHSGYVIGMCGWWQSPYFGEPDIQANELFNSYVNTLRNVTAVSDMCMMISSQAFSDVGGFDESFTHSGEDVDLCIRLLHKRYHNIYTPFVRMMLSDDEYTGPKVSEDDITRCYDMCRDLLAHGDPYYNHAYDYSSTVPEIAETPYPAIKLNPNYNS